ncbi:hypothetical protein BYT27DRAFT_7116379, partial [Phlegmacium glaucopus]
GLILSPILAPVSCVQAWYYFTHQTDTWPIKLLVSAVMFFDTIHQVLITHTVYTYTVTNWGTPAELQKLVWLVIYLTINQGLTALLVQSFLAMRVWRLSNRRIALISVVALLVLGEFGMFFSSLKILHFKTFAQLVELKALSILVNALAAAGDLLIAGTLCVILHLSRTGFRRQVPPAVNQKFSLFINLFFLYRSDTMINKLILFAVNTGFLTSICAVASLVSIVVAGHTFIYIGFFFCIGRLYTNSLLATLNARKMIRIAGEGIQATSENFSVSLREFPPMTTMRPTSMNISMKFGTDSDQELDLEKSEVSVSDSRLPLLYQY